MKKKNSILNNIIRTALILILTFLLSLALQYVHIEEHITTLFVFSVFLVSLMTDGYWYGIASAVIGTLMVNYAFTFPYFALNFTIPANLLSAVIMITLALMTSALTTENKRQQSIKAESEKERMRANLLRAVSHDLRTPLTSIYGSSSVLLESGNTMTQTQKEEMLKGICEDSQWLVQMVENLLSITRIDEGKVKIIKTPMVVEELIDSVMVKFSKRYPEFDVELTLPEEIIIVPMDALLIEQVLFNLLENAMIHAQEMTQLSLSVHSTKHEVIFEVADNGCGIEEERMKALFTGTFEPEEGKADTQKHNTGIGLSVCATIIKAHDGKIHAENLKDGGALFRFTLAKEEEQDGQQK
ncbi:MAG: PAS domain-containing sensor histidine kinase [Erysipelotrichaceae bacterium]|nr:PAS domain-containing sensor histidine kinase [Erysipelotrichaceae bacterium]